MKTRVTKKLINENYNTVVCVPYCALQSVLNYRQPEHFVTRTEGWACDVYEVSPGTVITTGYAPFGKWKIPYEACRQAEEMAIGKSETERDEILKGLLNNLVVNK